MRLKIIINLSIFIDLISANLLNKIIAILIFLVFYGCHFKNDYSINNVTSSKWTEKSIETQILFVDSIVNSGSLSYGQEILKYDTLTHIANAGNLKEALQNIYRRYGSVYMNLGDLRQSIDYLIKSAQISDEINDTLAYWSTMTNIGNVYQYFKLPEKAKNYLDSAQHFYLSNQYHPFFIANSAFNLSLVYENLNQNEKAVDEAKMALLYKKKTNEDYLKSDSNLFLINYISKLGKTNISEAKSILKLNGPLFSEENNPLIRLQYWNVYTNLENSSFYVDSIKNYLNQDFANADKLEMAQELSLFYNNISNSDSAFKYQTMLMQWKDSLYDTQKLSVISNSNNLYELLKNKEIKLLHQEQKTKNTWLAALAATLLLLCFVGFLYFQNQKNKRKKTIAENNLNINKLIEEVNQTKMEAWAEGQEKERSRIANELHDRLGGVLAMASHHFNSVEAQFELMKQQNNSAIADLKKLLNNAIIEVRELSKDISSNLVNKLGLSNALGELIDTVKNATELTINFKPHKADYKLPLNKEIALYRVAQEALNNIMKHAKASTVEVSLVANKDSMVLMIEDNGIGFENKENLINSLGLKSMRKRMEDLEGRFTIDSQKKRGTTLIAEIPF